MIDRLLNRKQDGRRKQVNWNNLVQFILMVMAINTFIFLVINFAQSKFRADDKICVAAWGVDFDHQSVEGTDGYSNKCVNTKNEKDVRPLQNFNRNQLEKEAEKKVEAKQ